MAAAMDPDFLRTLFDFATSNASRILKRRGQPFGEPLEIGSNMLWDELDEMGREMTSSSVAPVLTAAAVTGMTVSVG